MVFTFTYKVKEDKCKKKEKKTSVFGCHTFIDFLFHSCFNEMPDILNFPLIIYLKTTSSKIYFHL